MKTDDPDIPEPVIEAWTQALARMTPKALQALAADLPALSAGFRPGRIDPAIARARANRLITRRGDWPEAFSDALRAQTLQPTLLAVLSESFIESNFDALADHFGHGELLDPREPVHKLAFERLEPAPGGDDGQHGTTAPPSARDTAAALRRALAPLLAHLGGETEAACGDPARTGDGAPAPAADTASPSAAPAARAPRPANERRLVLQAREARLEATRLRRSVGDLSSSLAAEQARVNRLQSEQTRTQGELAAARRELQALQRQTDERVRQQVQARIADELLPWLAPARQLADFGRDPAGEPLETARRVLAEQRQLDRRHGLRSALRDEHDACAAALRQLQDAQRDALVPHPGLPGAIDRLRERMRRIEQQLGRSAPLPVPGATLQRLAARLAAATTLEQVSRLRRTLLHCEALDLFDDAELDTAFRLLGEATSRAYARAEADPAASGIGAELGGVPLHALRRALAAHRACELAIDGHNVLHKLHRQLGERARASGPGSAEARTALIESVCSLGARHPGLHLHLWFDSSMPEDLTLRGNVGVHYSGGQGQDRADRQIVAHLEFLARERPGTLAAVVSADGEIVAAAEQAGALVLAPHEFGGWLAPGS